MSYSATGPPACCSYVTPDLKTYQAFIFSVPVFFTFLLLLLFYLFYLRRRRVDWSSLRMTSEYQTGDATSRQSESGLKKELREMLPVIIFTESFQLRETQCSVCLGDYQANEQLQQIPSCGHTFHMDCIDHWLAKNTTCPLCRISLLPPLKSTSEPTETQSASDRRELDQEAAGELIDQPNNMERAGEDFRNCTTSIRHSSCCSSSSSEEQQFWDAVKDMERHGDDHDTSVVIDIDANVSRV